MDRPITTLATTGDHRQRKAGIVKLSLAPILIALLLQCTSARGQAVVPDTTASRFSVSLSLGFNTFALDDVRNFYDGLLEIYRANGIPIPTQREFPGNLLVGASFLYAVPSVVDIGLGGRYTWTRAFSSYEDYAGTANVDGKVTMFTLEGIIQKAFTPESDVNMYLGVRGGLVFGSSEYSQKIVFTTVPNQNAEILLSASGKGFTAEGYIGANHRLNNIVLGASAGYRYAKISDMNADITVDGQPLGSGTLEVDHDLSGFVLVAHVDFAL